MPDGDEIKGAAYTEKVLRPRRALVIRASSITSDGVESITMLELEGVDADDGEAYKFAVEFSSENGALLGQSMIDVAAPK